MFMVLKIRNNSHKNMYLKPMISELLLICVLLFALPSCDQLKELAGIKEEKKSDIIDTFTDDALRECIARQTSGLNAAEVFDVICAGNAVRSLDGLEQFTNVRSLILNSNILSSVDLSPYPNLKFLDLSRNRLNTIDITNNPLLIEVFIDENSLDELDTSQNPLLEALILSDNDLSALDLRKNIKLEVLIADQNKFVGDMTIGLLDLSKNDKLINLNLFRNEITHIGLANNLNLDFLDMRQNDLQAIDLTKNKNITELKLSDNKLTAINLNGAESLDKLFLEDNLIEQIWLPLTGMLRFAYLRGNKIDCENESCNGGNTFQVPRNTSFIHLDLSDNLLQDADIEELDRNLYFTELLLSGNNLEGEIDLSRFTEMVEIRLDDTDITSITFGPFTSATSIFANFDFQVITAFNTTELIAETRNLLDDMETKKGDHPVFDDSSLLNYLY
jgi:hypothetical protein